MAAIPLNLTVSAAELALKFVPDIVTVVPAGPVTGLMAEIAGGMRMAF
jgi:hypothetical protein